MSAGPHKFFVIIFIGIAVAIGVSVYTATKEAIHAARHGVVSTPSEPDESLPLAGRAEKLVGHAGRGVKDFIQDKLLQSHSQAQPLPGQYPLAQHGQGRGAGESYYPDAGRK